jgi:hypothetical protein
MMSLFPPRESLASDIPAGDGNIGNKISTVWKHGVHIPVQPGGSYSWCCWPACSPPLPNRTCEYQPTLQRNPIYAFLFWELRVRSPDFHIHVSLSDLYAVFIPRIAPHISLQQNRQTNPRNLSQIYECRNWETGHYNSVLEITVSFLGIHKWEPDLYIGFSFAVQGRPRFHPHTPVIRANTCRLY